MKSCFIQRSTAKKKRRRLNLRRRKLKLYTVRLADLTSTRKPKGKMIDKGSQQHIVLINVTSTYLHTQE